MSVKLGQKKQRGLHTRLEAKERGYGGEEMGSPSIVADLSLP